MSGGGAGACQPSYQQGVCCRARPSTIMRGKEGKTMKKHATRRKVTLSRETLHHLEDRPLRDAVGGVTLTCPGVTCKPTQRGITGCSVQFHC